MAQRRNLTGEKFGKLEVIKLHGVKNNRRVWLCKCDCGNECVVTTAHLTTGSTISCGCMRKGVNAIDLTGKKYGKLVAVEPTDKRMGNSVKWLCKCDCGNECVVASINLRNGSTTSCGCKASKIHSKAIETARNLRNEYMIAGTDVIALANTKPTSRNTSGYKGVSYDTSVRLWKATITFKGVKYYLGGYKDKKDAIEARKKAEKEIHSPFLEWYETNYPENWRKLKNY